MVERAIKLLEHEDTETLDNAVMLLGNVAGDSTEYRDYLVKEHDILAVLLKNLNQKELPKNLFSNVMWLIANLTRKPYLSYSNVSSINFWR